MPKVAILSGLCTCPELSRRGRASFKSSSFSTPNSLYLLLRVMALPLRLSTKALITGTEGLLPAPMVMLRGIPATIWAASRRPVATPWASAFQLGSRCRITSSNPSSAKKPFSLAIIIGAQSVRGIKPMVGLVFNLVAWPITVTGPVG